MTVEPGLTGPRPGDTGPGRKWRRPPVADIVGAVGAVIVLASAVAGWAGTSGGLSGGGDPHAPSGIIRSVRAFTPVPLVATLAPLWSLARRARGRRSLPGWALVLAGALILLTLALGGVHLVTQAAGRRAPEIYAVPRRFVAVAALGASAIIVAGVVGLFTASPTVSPTVSPTQPRARPRR